MDCTVRRIERADEVLECAGRFLASRPVEHNLILTLLDDRCASGDPGRYWVVEGRQEVVGVVFQSPSTTGRRSRPCR